MTDLSWYYRKIFSESVQFDHVARYRTYVGGDHHTGRVLGTTNSLSVPSPLYTQ
jgi:hypothetical protein